MKSVTLGIQDMIKKNECLLYICSLAVAIVVNYYTGYMLCLFSLLYFLYEMILEYITMSRISLRKYCLKKVVFFTIGSLLAAGISAITLIPALCSMSGGRGPGDLKGLFHFTSQFKSIDFFSRLYIGAYAWEDVSATLPNIYVGMIMLALCMLYFFSDKIELKEKLLSGLFLLIMFLSCKLYFLNILWHGLNEPHGSPVRYSYMISCLVILLAYKAFTINAAETGNRRQRCLFRLIFCGILFLFVSCIVYKQYYEYFSKVKLVISIGVFALCMAVLFIYQLFLCIRKYGFILLGGICCLELVVNAYVIYSVFPFRDIDYQSTYVAAYLPAINRIKELDQGFYRMEKTTSVTTNDPMLFRYAGISHDSSFHKYTLQEFCDNLGLTSHGSIIHYDRNASLSTDCLLGVKYLLAEEAPNTIYQPIETTAEGITIYENPYALPIVYQTHSVYMNEAIPDNQPFEYQNAVFRAISGNEEAIFKPCDTFTVLEEQQAIEYTITAQNTQPMYAFFQAEVPYADLYINGEEILSLNSNAYDFYFNGLLPLGEHKPGDEVAIRIEAADEDFSFELPEFYYQDIEVLETDYEKLVINRPTIKKLSNSEIEIHINVQEDMSNLVFTVPYDKGWTVKIDNKKTASVKAFNALLAVEVPEGEHIVTFSYFPSGLDVGIFVTICSILASVLFIKKLKFFEN